MNQREPVVPTPRSSMFQRRMACWCNQHRNIRTLHSGAGRSSASAALSHLPALHLRLVTLLPAPRPRSNRHREAFTLLFGPEMVVYCARGLAYPRPGRE